MHVQNLFHQGQTIIRGKIASPKIVMPLGQEGGGAEYSIIIKERLVLASALYTPRESFYHQGQKHTISKFIIGILRGLAYTPLI